MKLTDVQKRNLLDLIRMARRGGYQGGSYGTVSDRALIEKGLALKGFTRMENDTRWSKKGDKVPRMIVSPLGWEIAKEHGFLNEDESYPAGYDKMETM